MRRRCSDLQGSFTALQDSLGQDDLLDAFPHIRALIAKVHELPAIREWDESEARKDSKEPAL